MPTTVVSLILPFATPDKERGKTLSPSMEVAAVLLLAEAKRKKRGILGTAPKKTSFVSKLHYPLWAIPWENGTLIVDGLGISYLNIIFQALPDIALFIDDIERSSSSRKQFQMTLEKHEKTFKDFAKTESIRINSLVTDPELLLAVSEYVKDTQSSKLESSDTLVMAPPKLDLQAAVDGAQQVSKLWKRIQSDIRSLEYTRNLLDETAKVQEQMILKEIEFTRAICETEISNLQPAVDKKVNQILKERDARLNKMRRISENELRTKERERERRERELQRLELAKADFLKKKKNRKRRHDKIGETHWEHRIRVFENKIDELRARIHALSEFIEKTRRQSEADTEKLIFGYQALIDRERKEVGDIEFQRDRSVEGKKMESEKLKADTSRIVNQLDELAQRKRIQEEELKKSAAPWQFEDATLLCLPFYVVCYKRGKKAQFQIFPPLRVMSSEGIVKSLQKTIRNFRTSSELKPFLEPRSKVLGKMLDFVFEEKMRSDKAFNESLLRTAASSNILERLNLRETLTKGVDELKSAGWIGQRQGNALIKTYIST